ncbi:MAG: glycosyltransferase family 4 protein [Bacteriovoracaceae bacterium]|nr:glycosyltransferase family 4 protein [Bacteriovoracaceae bacterium]
MRVLIVTQYFWPEQFRVNDIARALNDKGYEVIVLTGLPNYPGGKIFSGYSFRGPYRENYSGVTVVRVPLIPRGQKKNIFLALNYFSFLLFSSILGPFFIKGRIDKIFVYQPSPVTVAFPAVILKWIKRAPIIFWVTDLWPETLSATGMVKKEWVLWLWSKFVKFLYKNSDRILVTSRGFIEKIVSRGIDKEKVEYWPQWGEDLFTSEAISNEVVGYDQNLIPDGFKIMFAGNIGTSQGFETIVEAAAMLKYYRDIHWVVLGDGLMKEWVEVEILNRGLTENFHLLGRKPLEAMPLYYKNADLLLASLKKDPLFTITVPAKIQSYLPSGKPIIVSMDGEGASLIEQADAGVSCKAGCPQSLAEGVLKIYGLTQGERVILGANGRKYFFNNFDRNKLLMRLEEILNTL